MELIPCTTLACTAANCITSSLPFAPWISNPQLMPTSLQAKLDINLAPELKYNSQSDGALGGPVSRAHSQATSSARTGARCNEGRWARDSARWCAGRGPQADCFYVGLASARVPRRRHVGAVLPQKRLPVGDRAEPCRCGRGTSGADRVARRRAVARRVPAEGSLGVRQMNVTIHDFTCGVTCT
jgi:hypothetical protein